MERPDEYRILRVNLTGPASKAGSEALERLVAEVNQLLRDGWQVSGPLECVFRRSVLMSGSKRRGRAHSTGEVQRISRQGRGAGVLPVNHFCR